MPKLSRTGRACLSSKRKKRKVNIGLLKWRLNKTTRFKPPSTTSTSAVFPSTSQCMEMRNLSPRPACIVEENEVNEQFSVFAPSCSSTPHIPRQCTRRKLDMSSLQCESKQPKINPFDGVMMTLSEVENENANLDNSDEIMDGTPVDHVIEGRRIIDFNYFFRKLKEINNHNEAMGCTINNMFIKSEHLFGFRTKIVLKCNMCSFTYTLSNVNPDDLKMDVNTASVAGAIAIGIGFSQLHELFSTMEIPCMSYKTYDKYHNKVADAWEETALQEMQIAAREEIDHAITEGSVSSDGVPILTVVADGSWAKRSYRTNYNSLAGVAAIVGFHTKKVIFLGVRNKYCTICARAANIEAESPPHTCYKNWTGSSTRMESDIIVEGFHRSLEMYGAVYGTILADGDSSVYNSLIETRPYPNLTIEKIECSNHLLRNFCSKLKSITVDSKQGPIGLRKVVGSSILRLRTGVTKAVAYRKNESSLDINKKLQNLRKDLVNSPSHVFGEHKKCSEIGYFCSGPKEGETNHVPALRECGLYQQIMKYVNYLADNSRSLLMHLNNNTAEHFNAIVAKFIGGKRVNYTRKRSYQARCSAAVVSHNTRLPLYKLHKSMYEISPGKYLKSQQSKRAAKIAQAAKKRKDNPLKQKRCIKTNNEVLKKDKDYGFMSRKPDIPPELYKEKENEFLNSMDRSEVEIAEVERATRLQAASGMWKEERRKLLTASNFGTVCKRRKSTRCDSLVKTLLYRDVDCASMRFGRENESLAIEEFEQKSGLNVEKCGLFIDKCHKFLGATPDGLIGSDSIIEVKCPITCKDLTPDEGILAKKITFWSNNGNVNKDHNYFYQIQGQLHVTKREFCYFVLWTPLGIRWEIIEREDEFWENKMIDKLTRFYYDCLLPELIDPRHTRSMPIRNPEYIEKAILEIRKENKVTK